MHLTTPTNALNNFAMSGMTGNSALFRYTLSDWDDLTADEESFSLIPVMGGSEPAELPETKGQS
jgi:hypothetical protein